tara:strand:- start:511 stop:642 length:132 start_codon:yes stop_codon:yes gene_type:complete
LAITAILQAFEQEEARACQKHARGQPRGGDDEVLHVVEDGQRR